MHQSKFSPESFDNFYNSFFNYNVSLFQMIQDIKGNTNNKDILDLACGTGISTRALAKVFDKSNILGIDADDKLIDYANMGFNPQNVKYTTLNALHIHKLDKKFDFIIAKSALHLINEDYIFNDYMSVLKKNGTFYAIERTNVSVKSFPIFDDAKKIWEKQYNQKRKLDCIAHYMNLKEYKIETFKFGQKVDIETQQYRQGIINKEMSCLWSFENQQILNWIENDLPHKDFVSVFEEYDIIAITKLH